MALTDFRYLTLRLQGARMRDGESAATAEESAHPAFLGPAHARLHARLAAETEETGEARIAEAPSEGVSEDEFNIEELIEELRKIVPEAGNAPTVNSASGHQFEPATIAALGDNIDHLGPIGDEDLPSRLVDPEPDPGILRLLFQTFSFGATDSPSPITLAFTSREEEEEQFPQGQSPIYLFGPATANPPSALGATDTLTSPPLPGFGTVEVTFEAIDEVKVEQTTFFTATSNLAAASPGSGEINVYNFQQVDVTFGTSLSAGAPVGSSVTIGPMGAGGRGVMRGSVVTGAGDDVIDITAYSYGAFPVFDPADFTIDTDGGDDTIAFTGTNLDAMDNEVAINAGAGNDTVTLGDFYLVSVVDGGPGDDALSGGTGDDTFRITGTEGGVRRHDRWPRDRHGRGFRRGRGHARRLRLDEQLDRAVRGRQPHHRGQ